MLSTVAGDDLVDPAVSTQREVDLQNVVAGLHQSQNTLNFFALFFDGGSLLHVFDKRVLDDLTSAVEEIFDLVDTKRKINKLIREHQNSSSPCRKI